MGLAVQLTAGVCLNTYSSLLDSSLVSKLPYRQLNSSKNRVVALAALTAVFVAMPSCRSSPNASATGSMVQRKEEERDSWLYCRHVLHSILTQHPRMQKSPADCQSSVGIDAQHCSDEMLCCG